MSLKTLLLSFDWLCYRILKPSELRLGFTHYIRMKELVGAD